MPLAPVDEIGTVANYAPSYEGATASLIASQGGFVISRRREIVFIVLLWAVMSCTSIARAADNGSIVNVAKAAAIAYARFEVDLERGYSEHPISEDTIELLVFSRNPGNYDMGVSQTNELYVVVFLPRRVPPFENVTGGGGEYRIRKSDLSVMSSMGYR
ncbi:hypothetical protein [Luteimonas sp. RC10]|uniref:hypothetical protein n=1 Tax=Luteimonas sp. RC10 TaxID=2587035 RepID=UPI00180890D8|nr:hypothetical protein [Luteimonas sp. RC10]MBB3344729.1 hypothetical protein [Luteimonas sp. RC10]